MTKWFNQLGDNGGIDGGSVHGKSGANKLTQERDSVIVGFPFSTAGSASDDPLVMCGDASRHNGQPKTFRVGQGVVTVFFFFRTVWQKSEKQNFFNVWLKFDALQRSHKVFERQRKFSDSGIQQNP